MSLPLLLSYLRHGWGTMAAWGGSLFLYGWFMASIYRETAETFSTALVDFMRAIPEPLKAAMGAAGLPPEALLDPRGMFSVEGYLGTQYTAFWPLLLAGWAVMSMGGTISREMERNTIDLVLASPLPRYRLVLTKFFHYSLALAVVTLIAHVGTVAGFRYINISINEWALFLAFVEGSLLVVVFAAVSLLSSCLFLDPRRSVMLSGLVMAALYMLNIFAPIFAPPWDALGHLSPFYYYRSLQIMQTATLDTDAVVIYLGITAISLLAAVLVFQRKDLVR